MEDYEKKYKQALDWMQSLCNGLHGKTKEEAEHFFPELKESKSEDEKIREELKFYLEVRRCRTTDDEEYISCNRFLAWLEKQGEQKPTDLAKSNERVVKLQGDFADINNERGCVKGINDSHKTNQEKAKEIATGSQLQSNHFHDQISVEYGALKMAEWKDEQFKQDLDNAFKSADHVQYTNGYNDAVEKACEILAPTAISHKHVISLDNFRKAMQEEQQ